MEEQMYLKGCGAITKIYSEFMDLEVIQLCFCNCISIAIFIITMQIFLNKKFNSFIFVEIYTQM